MATTTAAADTAREHLLVAEQSQLRGALDGTQAVANVQLVEHPFEVVLDRLRTQVHRFRDGLVAVPASEKRQGLLLPRSQLGQRYVRHPFLVRLVHNAPE